MMFKQGLAFGMRIAAAATIMTAAAGSSHAETDTQRRACKPDVFRLCAEFVPNRAAITNCLLRNMQRLSPACHAVMDGTLK